MKTLIFLITALIYSSCVTVEKKIETKSIVIIETLTNDEAVIRAYSDLIAAREYIINKYDCSNKAYDLSILLRERGYDARIYVFHPNQHWLHAIVELNGNYIDPTMGEGKTFLERKPDGPMYAIFIPDQLAADNEWYRVMIKEFTNHLNKITDEEGEEIHLQRPENNIN